MEKHVLKNKEDLIKYMNRNINDVDSIYLYDENGNEINIITIPEGIEEIPDYAFNNVENLKEVIFPTTLKIIGKESFLKCKNLKNIVFKSQIEEIKDKAFTHTALEAIYAPKGIKIIKEAAFSYNEDLKEIYIPRLLKELGFIVFKECPNIKKVTIPTSTKSKYYGTAYPTYYKNAEVNFILNTSLSEFILNRNFEIKEGHLLNEDEEEISELIIESDVKEIPDNAFNNFKNIQIVTIKEGLKTIPKRCFLGMDNLKIITIPKTIKSIMYNAFEGCRSLTSINIESEEINIKDEAFKDCINLEEVIFKGKVNICFNAFSHCTNLKEMQIENYKNDTLHHKAFSHCSSLRIFQINGAKNIDNDCFEECSSLKIFDGGMSLETINSNAFKNCKKLKKLYLPVTFKSFSNYAFIGCENLEKIYYDGSRDDWYKKVNIDEANNDNSLDLDALFQKYFGLPSSKEEKEVINKVIIIHASDMEFSFEIKI